MIFDFAKWNSRLGEMGPQYRNAHPYPHIVIEGILDEAAARKALEDFPRPDSGEWMHYKHVNENKLAQNTRDAIPASLLNIIDELQSKEFCAYLSELTGIPNLLADESLDGGGLHQSKRGGYLNIHADFTAHPRKDRWRRRVNVLVYLNEGWQDEYGGQFELWDREMKGCVKKISPIFNRSVIFSTDKDTFHGHPHPMTCPEGATRKSIALYYFTEEDHPLAQATLYKAAPEDSFKRRLFIKLDNVALRVYDKLRRRLKISDKIAATILKILGGGK